MCSSLVHDCQVQYAAMPSGLLLERIGCSIGKHEGIQNVANWELCVFSYLCLRIELHLCRMTILVVYNPKISKISSQNYLNLVRGEGLITYHGTTRAAEAWITVYCTGLKCSDHLPRCQKSPLLNLIESYTHYFFKHIQIPYPYDFAWHISTCSKSQEAKSPGWNVDGRWMRWSRCWSWCRLNLKIRRFQHVF